MPALVLQVPGLAPQVLAPVQVTALAQVLALAPRVLAPRVLAPRAVGLEPRKAPRWYSS